MIEKIGHIKNPLTVIAMFAGIAELSGTVVLPFLDVTTQHIYVWFLMFFPCLLVSAFFGTLLKRHHVLYAPSDFKDEQIFANMFKPVSIGLRAERLEEDASEESRAPLGEAKDAEQKVRVIANVTTFPEINGGAKIHNDQSGRPVITQHQLRYLSAAEASLAEDLVITRLASEHQIRFSRNVSPSAMPSIMFDAIGGDEKKQFIVEVKYSRSGRMPASLFYRVRDAFLTYYRTLSDDMQRNLSFIIAIVLDGDAEANTFGQQVRLSSIVSEWGLPVQVRVYAMSELRQSAAEVS
jgi:hypothetical protein